MFEDLEAALGLGYVAWVPPCEAQETAATSASAQVTDHC